MLLYGTAKQLTLEPLLHSEHYYIYAAGSFYVVSVDGVIFVTVWRVPLFWVDGAREKSSGKFVTAGAFVC
jgi:hypothetical protein